MKIEFERAIVGDAEALIEVKNKSFYADYIKYGECPGYNNTVESMTYIILERACYKIICDDILVGNITARNNPDGSCYVGCLCIIPEYENRGIGQMALRFIESQFPDASVWTLETPADKKRNHYFYQKAGYRIVKEFTEDNVKLVLFEKRRSQEV
jgi:Acetyltransferases